MGFRSTRPSGPREEDADSDQPHHNALTIIEADPVGYVNRYSGEAPGDEHAPRYRLHESVQRDMDPMMDTLNRSQRLRGVRDDEGADMTSDPIGTLRELHSIGGSMPPERLEQILRRVWEAHPTDDVGEGIDAIAKRHRVTPPWAR